MPGGSVPEGEHQPIMATARRPGRLRRVLRFIARIIGLFLLVSVMWSALYVWMPVPITPLMVIRMVEGQGFKKDWVSYDQISPNLPRAAIAARIPAIAPITDSNGRRSRTPGTGIKNPSGSAAAARSATRPPRMPFSGRTAPIPGRRWNTISPP
jgi:hypothetical protein